MAFELTKVTGILQRVKTPLTLAGLALLIFYGVLSKILDLKIFSPLQEGNTAQLVGRILFYTFIIALVCVVLGVGSFILTYLVRPSKPR